jgi:hypothetical protein
VRLLAGLVAGTLVVAGCAGDDRDEGNEGMSDTATTLIDADASDIELAAATYVAGYPLVVTVRTLQRLGGLVGVNTLFWQTSLSGPQSRTVVAPNRDTLYTIAVLDLRSEPMVLTLPAVEDRYYTYQLLDAWTGSFAYVGTRATGGRAGTWVITPPGWDGGLPEGAQQIEAPTPQLMLLGRFLVDGVDDVADVTAIGRRSSLRPLSAVTGGPVPPPPPPVGQAAGTAQDIPGDATFFDELARALAVNPPTTAAQRDLFERASALGIDPGAGPATGSAAGASADRVGVLDEGAALGLQRITDRIADTATVVNGWSANLDVGTYGDDTLMRAVVARVGWGANVPDEAVYPVARVDGGGDALDGRETYRIRFPAGGLPPVDGFWSLSAYGTDMFFVEHPSGRYTIGDRTPDLELAEDGSLEIVLAHDEPAGAANWLPVPDGPFVLMLRLYLPRPPVLDGEYAYPLIERLAR